MWFFKKKKNKNQVIEVLSPADGEIVSTKKVKDETFSKDMIGKGFAIIPSSNDICAPITGEITLVAETGHAFSIKADNDVEVLVHIGLDTVNINNKKKPEDDLVGFKLLAKTGDKVQAGTPIINADLALIKKKKYDIITPVIIINNEASANITVSDLLVTGKTTKGTKVLEVK